MLRFDTIVMFGIDLEHVTLRDRTIWYATSNAAPTVIEMEYAVNIQEHDVLAGRYRIGRLLGSGGFGAVYFATDERLRRPVAIKICSTRRLATDEAEEAATLFQREALTLARLRHPGLTAIWDYFSLGSDWYLVMEYVPGVALRDKLRNTPDPLPISEALEYAWQVCQVLSYLHSQQPPIIFRDLKPGNIIITPNSQVKLIDFGIARLFSPGKLRDTIQFGTPGYAPPEQYGGQTEPRSDIYALGVTLHQMLTGHNPATSPFRLPAVRSLNPAVSTSVEQLIADATAHNIEQRIPNANAFCSQLEIACAAALATQPLETTSWAEASHQRLRPAIAEGTPPAQLAQNRLPPRALPEPPISNGMGRGLLVAFLVLLMLGAVATAAYLFRDGIALNQQSSTAASVPAAAAAAARVHVASTIPDAPPSLVVFTDEEDQARNIYSALVQQQDDTLTLGSATLVAQLQPGEEAQFPTISPDGKRIAYTRSYTANDSSAQRSEVWLMNIDGSAPKQVLMNYAFARAPAWNPVNATQLAAEVATRDNLDQRNIVLFNIDTEVEEPLLTSRNWEGGPAWAPDGTQIAFHALVDDAECLQLFKIDLVTKQQQQLTNLRNYSCGDQGGDQEADWGPHGKIAFTQRNVAASGASPTTSSRVAVWDPTQGDTPRITIFNNQSTDQQPLPFGYPRWSQNSQYVLFEEQRSANESGLGYLDPNTPNERDQYIISGLDVDEHTNIRYADWR